MKTLLLKLYNWIIDKVYNDEEFNSKRDKFLKEHE